MRKLAVESDNCVLDFLNVASQHRSHAAESRDAILDGVEVIGILAVVIKEGFSALI